MKLADIKRIRVYKTTEEGETTLYSQDNRRLYAYKVLENMGVLSALDVEYNSENTMPSMNRKFTTNCNGCHVFVRGIIAPTYRHCKCLNVPFRSSNQSYLEYPGWWDSNGQCLKAIVTPYENFIRHSMKKIDSGSSVVPMSKPYFETPHLCYTFNDPRTSPTKERTAQYMSKITENALENCFAHLSMKPANNKFLTVITYVSKYDIRHIAIEVGRNIVILLLMTLLVLIFLYLVGAISFTEIGLVKIKQKQMDQAFPEDDWGPLRNNGKEFFWDWLQFQP
ncbi:unnamed protein product [Clavelina lepadiformis]|uniref:Uncharacterized protein n=1 Tax=Clavelina lepadiformis TaxID=159417 RepID=A0ABP0H3D1_CLALP